MSEVECDSPCILEGRKELSYDLPMPVRMDPPSLDLVRLFVPANPFESLASGVVPATVVFSLALGAALIGMDDKQPVLRALSILSGAHNTMFPKVLELLRDQGGEDIVVFGGGIIPDEDRARLQRSGVKGIFTPGATTHEVIDWVRTNVAPRRR